LIWPQRTDQLVAPHRAAAVQQQVRQQQTRLPSAEPVSALGTADLDGQPPAQLDPGALIPLDRHGISGAETFRKRSANGAPASFPPWIEVTFKTSSAGRSETSITAESRRYDHDR
jgi:hypothetical protein